MKDFTASIVLTLFILIIVFQSIIFNIFFYDIFTDYPREKYIDATRNVLNYLTNKSELNAILYQEIEILHLSDVKNLVLAVQIKTISLALAIYFILKKWRLNLIKVFKFALIEVLLFTFIIYFSFGFLFLKFHELIFKNDFWILDPNIHLLIIIFPPEFFFKVLITTVITSLLIILGILNSLKFRKN